MTLSASLLTSLNSVGGHVREAEITYQRLKHGETVDEQRQHTALMRLAGQGLVRRVEYWSITAEGREKL